MNNDPETLIKVVRPGHNDVFEGELRDVRTLRAEAPQIEQDTIVNEYGTSLMNVNAGKVTNDTVVMVLEVPAKPVLDELREKVSYYEARVSDLEDDLSDAEADKRETQRALESRSDELDDALHALKVKSQELRDVQALFEEQTEHVQRLRDALGTERINEIINE